MLTLLPMSCPTVGAAISSQMRPGNISGSTRAGQHISNDGYAIVSLSERRSGLANFPKILVAV